MNAAPGHATRERVRQGADAYAQALARSGGQALQSLMREGARAAVCAAIYESPPYDLQVPALPVARLSVNLTPACVVGGVAGEPGRRYEAQPYSLFLAPAGVPTAWRKHQPSRHLNLYFPADELDGFGTRAPLHNLQLPGIRPLAERLAAELSGTDALRLEATDSLARLILVRLARQLRPRPAGADPLNPAMRARLHDYVLAHLSERILVADLAREAGLSPHHFAQVFSERMQRSPHQYVLALRVERALWLLRTSTLSLVDVAHDCGFANQQHLGNTLRRQLGTTPSRYRREHGTGARR